MTLFAAVDSKFDEEENVQLRRASIVGDRFGGGMRDMCRLDRLARPTAKTADEPETARGPNSCQRQLPFHQAVQLPVRLLLPHGQNKLRAANGGGQARLADVEGSR